MNKFKDLTGPQQQWVMDITEGMVKEGMDPTKNLHQMGVGIFPRNWLRRMSNSYTTYKYAPAWIVKDPSRRPDCGVGGTERGYYRIPEVLEYHEACVESKKGSIVDTVLGGWTPPEIEVGFVLPAAVAS